MRLVMTGAAVLLLSHFTALADNQQLEQSPSLVRTWSNHSRRVSSLCFTPDGKSILSGSFDKTVRLWDIDTGEEVRRYAGNENSVRQVASIMLTSVSVGTMRDN